MASKALKPLRVRTLREAEYLLRRGRSMSKYKRRLSDPTRIVDKSMSGNIFRAFEGLKERPSEVYRDWAVRIHFRLIATINKVRSQQQYDKVIQRFTSQLATHWKSVLNQKLPYGPATKMVNLLVKGLFLNDQLSLPSLPNWYNVPFDSYTLTPLVKIIDELLPDHLYAIPMNRQMTMNYVIQEKQYHDLQKAIRNLCTRVKRTPLDYELLAWDSRHKKRRRSVRRQNPRNKRSVRSRKRKAQ